MIHGYGIRRCDVGASFHFFFVFFSLSSFLCLLPVQSRGYSLLPLIGLLGRITGRSAVYDILVAEIIPVVARASSLPFSSIASMLTNHYVLEW